MVTQLKRNPEPEREPLYPSYWLVDTRCGFYSVSNVMAALILRAITARPKPRWVSFVDLSGARCIVRTDLIWSLDQTSPETRAMWRTIRAERKRESPEWYLES